MSKTAGRIINKRLLGVPLAACFRFPQWGRVLAAERLGAFPSVDVAPSFAELLQPLGCHGTVLQANPLIAPERLSALLQTENQS